MYINKGKNFAAAVTQIRRSSGVKRRALSRLNFNRTTFIKKWLLLGNYHILVHSIMNSEQCLSSVIWFVFGY